MVFTTHLTRETVSEERLGYPVCAGWFEEFCIWAKDWLDGNCSLTGRTDEDGNFVQSNDFNMAPMCNYHICLEEGSFIGAYLSRNYWVAMVEMFGYMIEEGNLLTDSDAVEPMITTRPLNTRSLDGEWSDADIIESIAEAKRIVIGTSE